jgi:hypothetical protein
MSFMRLSSRKGAHAVLSNPAWKEIRLRSGRDGNSVAKRELWREIIDLRMNCPSPERSEAEGLAVIANVCELS